MSYLSAGFATPLSQYSYNAQGKVSLYPLAQRRRVVSWDTEQAGGVRQGTGSTVPLRSCPSFWCRGLSLRKFQPDAICFGTLGMPYTLGPQDPQDSSQAVDADPMGPKLIQHIGLTRVLADSTETRSRTFPCWPDRPADAQ